MKKLIILKHSGGELANQLWNYISIYAYGLERNVQVQNPSFFEYHSYFQMIKREGLLARFFSFWFRNFSGRRASVWTRFWRFVYAIYSDIIKFIRRGSVISTEGQVGTIIYLPPTQPTTVIPNKKAVYFTGWLFRNPVGLEKFRKDILEAFRPNDIVEARFHGILRPLRQKYERIVGVHIRQYDYKVFKNGAYFIDQKRIQEIIQEYINQNNIDIGKISFLLTSDGHIDQSNFRDLNIYVSKENAVTDLFLLSKTDAIIGSDSSFGALAAWYGNIPHIIMKKEPIDWEYYRDRKSFFINKYCTFVHF